MKKSSHILPTPDGGNVVLSNNSYQTILDFFHDYGIKNPAKIVEDQEQVELHIRVFKELNTRHIYRYSLKYDSLHFKPHKKGSRAYQEIRDEILEASIIHKFYFILKDVFSDLNFTDEEISSKLSEYRFLLSVSLLALNRFSGMFFNSFQFPDGTKALLKMSSNFHKRYKENYGPSDLEYREIHLEELSIQDEARELVFEQFELRHFAKYAFEHVKKNQPISFAVLYRTLEYYMSVLQKDNQDLIKQYKQEAETIYTIIKWMIQNKDFDILEGMLKCFTENDIKADVGTKYYIDSYSILSMMDWMKNNPGFTYQELCEMQDELQIFQSKWSDF